MIRLILLRLGESYFRHRWLYLVPIVLMAGLAALYANAMEVRYISTGMLYVQNKSLLTSLTGEQAVYSPNTPAQSANAELRDLLQTNAFVLDVLEQTPLAATLPTDPAERQRALDDFRESVWANVAGDNLISFGALSDDPDLAQQKAGALMNTYVSWNRDKDVKESVIAQRFFADLIEPYAQDLDAAREELRLYLRANPPTESGGRSPEQELEIARLQAAINQASTRLNDAVNKEEEARLAMRKAESVAEQNYTIIDAPMRPFLSTSSLTSLAITIVAFLLVGVVLSLIGVIGGMLFDRSFRFAADVERVTSLPVLAQVPQTAVEPAPAPSPQPEAQAQRSSYVKP